MTALPAENSADSAILQAVDRAIADLRRGALVLLGGPHETAGLIQAAETASQNDPGRMREIAGASPLLLLTSQRAASLGIAGAAERVPTAGVIALDITGAGFELISELADPTSGRHEVSGKPASAPSPSAAA